MVCPADRLWPLQPSAPCYWRCLQGFPWWLSWQRIHLQCGRSGFNSWVGKILWRRERLPLQYSWISLVPQLGKNLPAMLETRVRSLGWEDPLEKGKATTPVFWPGESHGLYRPWGCKESDTFTFSFTGLIRGGHLSEAPPSWLQKGGLCPSLHPQLPAPMLEFSSTVS